MPGPPLWPPCIGAARILPLILPLVLLAMLAGCVAGEEPSRNDAESRKAPEAAYVGDEACASCHEAHYLSYHRTGMGRSMSRFDAVSAPEEFPAPPVHHAGTDFYYEAFVRSDTLFQREYRLNASGETTYERVHPAAWVIGSGNHTRSYLAESNGHFTEMPLTWYVQRGRWDLSPSYDQENLRFSRPVMAECMACHNGFSDHSRFTFDHYRDVADGITCERCHGPGGDHVDLRLAGLGPAAGAADSSIVHPARLARDDQLAVCRQCHLSGMTVFRPGETPSTWRPGEPLETHRSIFVTAEQASDPERFGIASHALRLAKSACFRESDMTCTTCHDPHMPVADLGQDHFNAICAGCHGASEGEAPVAVCGREGAHTTAEAMTGNCVACHLRASGASDIPHVTFTDHWIRRELPPAVAPEDIERVFARIEPFRLVRATAPPDAGHERAAALGALEEAAAWFAFYDETHALPAYLDSVIVRAEAGFRGGADHPAARLALGRALLEQGRMAEATSALSDAASAYPEDVFIQYWLGRALLQSNRPGEAVGALRRAADLQPAFAEAHLKLAEALYAAARFAEAEAAWLAGLAEDPVHHPASWNDLGFLYLEMGRLEEAGLLFDRALSLDPDLAPALVNAATLRLQAQDWAGAIRLLERAVRKQADSAPALGNLAIAYGEVGRTDEAVGALRTLLLHHPDDLRARALLDHFLNAGAEDGAGGQGLPDGSGVPDGSGLPDGSGVPDGQGLPDEQGVPSAPQDTL